MSRIHDALRKAAQDRATSQPAESVALPEETLYVDSAAENVPLPVSLPPKTNERTNEVVREAASYAVFADCNGFQDVRTRCAHPKWNVDPATNIFTNPEFSAHAAEQFRILRSKLYQLRNHQTLRTILVTSAVPKEGKTWVTANLAQAIARQPDRHVLMIDADLRASRLHMSLGAPPAPGLSDYLRGEADELSVIQYGGEGNLCLIAGGNAVTNPTELLSNGRFKQLLEGVTPLFDWVILDSPPCLSVADASILAGLCDGVLVVVRAGATPSEVAQRTHRELKNRNVVAVVLNRAEDFQSAQSDYYNNYRVRPSGNGNRGFKEVKTSGADGRSNDKSGFVKLSSAHVEIALPSSKDDSSPRAEDLA